MREAAAAVSGVVTRRMDRPVADADGGHHRPAFELDQPYVGMTRARKWLFLMADETPCKEIEEAWECFDWPLQ